MPAEHFFTGRTQAGRELSLFYDRPLGGGNLEPDAHVAALRSYREVRPSGGWDTEVERASLVGNPWHFRVAVTNGRVLAHLDVRMSDEVAQSWLAGGGTTSLNNMMADHIGVEVRAKTWNQLQEMAQSPIRIIAGRPMR